MVHPWMLGENMDENTTTIVLLMLVVIAGVSEVLRYDKARRLEDDRTNLQKTAIWWDEVWLHDEDGNVYSTDPRSVLTGTTIYPTMADAFASVNGQIIS